MSPEQARGAPLDRRTDIWSFGCVLYEMLTGRVPFAGGTISDTIAAILEREPDWRALPPETPVPVRRLLRRCLEKDRRRRLESASDARLEIDDAIASAAAEAPTPAATPCRRVTPVAIAALAGLTVIAALVAWILMRPRPRLLRWRRGSPSCRRPDFRSTYQASLAISRCRRTAATSFIALEGRTPRVAL